MHVSVQRHQQQCGAVAVVVALSIAVLIGFVGLALDLGQLFVSKTELQNAADACALSASAALTGVNANQLTIAENWGRTAGRANRVGFQGNEVNVVADQDVTFSDTLNGTYLTKGSVAPSNVLKMKYVKCSPARTGIKTWFMQVLNILPGVSISDQQVAAMGAATLQPSQTNCALPIALCAKATGYTRGDWLAAVVGPQDNITGDFQWINYVNNNSGKDIKDILAGAGVCNLPAAGAQVGAPGGKGGESDAWNTRFGIYSGSFKGPADGVPDFTGYAYTALSWPEQKSAYDGTSASAHSNFQDARDAYMPYQGDAASGINTKGSASTSTVHQSGSDRRLGIVPVVDCTQFSGGSHQAAIQNFACILMLAPMQQGSSGGGPKAYVEYLGAANDPASPCATIGLPGSATSAGPMVPSLVQ